MLQYWMARLLFVLTVKQASKKRAGTYPSLIIAKKGQIVMANCTCEAKNVKSQIRNSVQDILTRQGHPPINVTVAKVVFPRNY